MTALAEKITDQFSTLEEEEKLEVMSRMALSVGLSNLHDGIEDIIAERRADDLENGRDKGMTEEEFFAVLRQPVV